MDRSEVWSEWLHYWEYRLISTVIVPGNIVNQCVHLHPYLATALLLVVAASSLFVCISGGPIYDTPKRIMFGFGGGACFSLTVFSVLSAVVLESDYLLWRPYIRPYAGLKGKDEVVDF